jgi:hypothetical protein
MRPVGTYWGHFAAKKPAISTNGLIQNDSGLAQGTTCRPPCGNLCRHPQTTFTLWRVSHCAVTRVACFWLPPHCPLRPASTRGRCQIASHEVRDCWLVLPASHSPARTLQIPIPTTWVRLQSRFHSSRLNNAVHCTGFHCGLHQSSLREISSEATIPGTRHMMGGYRFGSGRQKMWFALAAVTFATARGLNVLALALQDREH